MIAKTCVWALGMLLAAPFCVAQNACPWINAATVTDAPDSAVSDLQRVVSDSGNTCTFHYRKSDISYDVQITIHKITGGNANTVARDVRCKSGRVALTGIGNEAFLCSSEHQAQVIARVRNQMFAVNVSARGGHGLTDMSKPLGDMVAMMAEQVAGNFF